MRAEGAKSYSPATHSPLTAHRCRSTPCNGKTRADPPTAPPCPEDRAKPLPRRRQLSYPPPKACPSPSRVPSAFRRIQASLSRASNVTRSRNYPTPLSKHLVVTPDRQWRNVLPTLLGRRRCGRIPNFKTPISASLVPRAMPVYGRSHSGRRTALQSSSD